MKQAKWILALMLAGVLVPVAWGQRTDDQMRERGRSQQGSEASGSSAKPSEGGNAADVQAGTRIAAQLMTAVDAKTAKPGDEVVARVTKNVKQHGRTVIRKGDRLVGHITSVEAGATAKAGSQVGVTFDRLVQGDAASNLDAVISAVVSAPAQQAQPLREPSMAPMPAAGRGSARGGGLVGGAVSSVGSTVGSTVDSTAETAGSTLGGVNGTVAGATETTLGANAGTSLATPLAAIRVDSAAQADNQNQFGSVLSTRHGNLHLDSGTQLQFRVASQAEVRQPTK